MNIVYSDHAKKRIKQRGISELDVEHALKHPNYVKKSFDGRFESYGEINNRKLKIIFTKKENYINVITVI